MTQRVHRSFFPTLLAAATFALALPHATFAQETEAQVARRAPQPVVPQMIRYSGVAANRAGDTVEAVFRIYASAQGGEPLWSETQLVSVGADGKYSVLLGGGTRGGLPDAVFQGGQARWVSVSLERAPEGGRSVLASVAYAMKAADAESLAGRRAADFVTQEQLSAQLASTAQNLPNGPGPSANPTGGGVTNSLALWTSATNLGNSAITQGGTASAPLLGVGTATPATTLDVAGATTLRGNVALPAASAATATAGVNSPLVSLGASSFQSGAAAVGQTFAWQSVASGNNTTTPTANLSLLFGAGAAAPAATGLSIAPTGKITFAAGQTFPGTGAGTLTGVTPASPLTGGGTAGNVALGLNLPALQTSLNAFYPQLAAANTFTGNQGVTGNVTATGTVSGLTLSGTTGNLGALNVATGAALARTALATATAQIESPALTFTGKAFNSATAQSVAQNFALAATPSGNNTATPAGFLDLFYSSGSNSLAATGLRFNSQGLITFATGQKFPGTGPGTITGVTATSPLTGGGATGSVALGLNLPALQTSLNPFYAQLSAANSFTASQGITGNLSVSGAATLGTSLVQGQATFNGNIFAGGSLSLMANNATAATGYNSAPVNFTASAFNSTTTKSTPQTFAFVSQPVGNNTANPSANLAVLFGSSGGVSPTGLSIGSNGQINFAPGQTFPGLITGVATTAPLTGGGTSGPVTLGLNLASLLGSLNADYAQLGNPNVFLADQTVQGNLTAFHTLSGNVVNSSTTLNIAGTPFDTGYFGQLSSFLGYANAAALTGSQVVGVGVGSLVADTSGSNNTAVGVSSLTMDQDGYDNTAVGWNSLGQLVGGCSPTPPPPPAFRPGQLPGESKAAALRRAGVKANGTCANPLGWGDTGVGYTAGFNDVTGIQNTSVGFDAGPDAASTNLIGATAIGANATVSQNYSVVLGQTTTTPGQLNASVGIGTATPMSALDVVVHSEGSLGPTLTLTNPSFAGGGQGSIDFNTTPPQTGTFSNYNPGVRIQAEDTNYSDNLSFYSNTPGSKNNGLRRNMTLYAGGGAQIVGNLNVTGTLSKGGGSFKIDHPLDPANKYLSHSFVESPDMMNIYNGLVVLDAHGKATVQMPDWFESLNSDFRYQLTAIGAPGPNLFVAEEINGNRFRIAGGKPGMKVSWQVTGIRQDAWANAHRIPVEEDKPNNERGYYLHPDLYGASADRQVGNAPKEK